MRYIAAIIICLFAWHIQAQSYVWAKGEGGIGNDNAGAITLDEQGNSYITGNLAGSINFSGTEYDGKGVYDIFITKYDVNGNVVWVKMAGGAGNDQGKSIKYYNGSLFVAGLYEDTAYFENTMLVSKGEADVFIAKYNTDGALQWVRSAGGSNTDYVASIDVDNDGNVVLVGNYESSANFGGTQLSTANFFNESFIAKYSNSGDVLWAKSVAGSNTNLITDVAYDNNGNYLITGFFGGNYTLDGFTVSSSTQSYDILIGKLDKSGNIVWLKKAGSIAEDAAQSICADKDGNAYITGYFTRTANFDANTVEYLDYNDIFVAKYTPDGSNAWVRAGNGSQLDIGFGITTDDAGNVYATGIFMFTINFNSVTATSVNGRDLFIVSYSSTGAVRWLTRAGGINTDCGFDLVVRPNDNIVLCGYYLNTCTFGDIVIDYAENNDLFIAEFNPPIVSSIEDVGAMDLKIYPNPVSDVLNIEVEGAAILKVYNVSGSLMYKGAFEDVLHINTSEWDNGLYVADVNTISGVRVIKLLKE